MVSGTLSLAARGISGFICVFVVVMYGFANAFMLSFGASGSTAGSCMCCSPSSEIFQANKCLDIAT